MLVVVASPGSAFTHHDVDVFRNLLEPLAVALDNARVTVE
jgi:hypothetical protein